MQTFGCHGTLRSSYSKTPPAERRTGKRGSEPRRTRKIRRHFIQRDCGSSKSLAIDEFDPIRPGMHGFATAEFEITGCDRDSRSADGHEHRMIFLDLGRIAAAGTLQIDHQPNLLHPVAAILQVPDLPGNRAVILPIQCGDLERDAAVVVSGQSREGKKRCHDIAYGGRDSAHRHQSPATLGPDGNPTRRTCLP